MRATFISLVAMVLLSTASARALAQDDQGSNQKTTTPAGENERPKSAVDKLLEEAKKRGEVVLARCLQDCENSGDQITGDVETGRALELPKPVYPAIAAAAHASGDVQIQLLIDTDGTVIAAAAVSGHPLLQAASVAAARGARFSPTKFNGEPVKVTGVITYRFVIQ
jgi:TonB family protein